MQYGLVSNYEIQFDGRNKRYVQYHVCLESAVRSTSVYRRYRQFRTLHAYLAKRYPEYKFRIPPRRIFGSSFDLEFLRDRCIGLDRFVSEISRISVIMEDEYVLSFFMHDTWECSDILNLFTDTLISSSISTDQSRPTLASFDCTSFSSSSNSILRGVLYRTLSFFSRQKSGPNHTRRCVSEPVMHCLMEEFSSCPTPSTTYSYSSSNSKRLSANDFTILRTIGKGSFGKVYLVRFKFDQKYYAMKVIPKHLIKEEADYRHIMSERNILCQDMDHPFLVKVKCTFQSELKLYIVMQYVNGGEIFFHLQREIKFTELRAKFYAAEIVSAFEYLHQRDIVYRDLKPENILLDSTGHVVLVDFGLAKDLLTVTNTCTFCGTPEYLAPEIILNKRYGKEIDWWCLGSVLYEMLVGLPPFYSKSRSEIFDKVLYEPPSFTNTAVTPEARDLILLLLKKNPTHRLGHGKHGALHVKSHPFFREINWEKLNSRGYVPPYIPNIKNDYGLDNFDPEFLRESISKSVYDQPYCLNSTSSTCTNPLLSSDSDMNDISSQMFYEFWNDPQDRQLLFVGFSYADTIEI